jgi:predicted esterase
VRQKALFAAAVVLTWITSQAEARAESAPTRWCAPELEALSDGICHFSPELAARGPRKLVIFLHPLVGAGSNWQWDQQRLFARLAQSSGFSVLMPRGRLGIGPGRAPNIYAWPTSAEMQAKHEDALVAEWTAAREAIEKRATPFEKVLVFGFSNGAYYATSLAMRGRLGVDGYGIFAGGSGGKYMRFLAGQTQQHAPIFVGYGTKDPAHKDQRELIKMLKSIGWKHRSKAANVGHTVTEDQLQGALRFLLAPDEQGER